MYIRECRACHYVICRRIFEHDKKVNVLMYIHKSSVYVQIHYVIESFGDNCHVEHNSHLYLKAPNTDSHLSTSSRAVLSKLGDL